MQAVVSALEMSRRAPTKELMLSVNDVERFWSKVSFNGPIPPDGIQGGRCWGWEAGKSKAGYGQFALDRKPVKAHRVSYTINIGDIPTSLVIDHLCKNKGCCNPAHLEPVTHRENAIRCDSEVGINARRTHCKNGHELCGDNLFVYKPSKAYPHGRRYCRQCRRDSEKALAFSPVTLARVKRKLAFRKARYVYKRGPHGASS